MWFQVVKQVVKEDERITVVKAKNSPRQRGKGNTMQDLRHFRNRSCSRNGRGDFLAIGSGTTLIELVIVLVILAIAAALAIPMISSASGVQVRSAANLLASDLEYAKNMSISSGQNYSLVFVDGQSYKVCDQSGSTVSHPVSGKSYVVDYSVDGRLEKVTISNVDIQPGSSQQITFDYLGSPYSGSGTSSPLNSAQITLSAGGTVITVLIEAVTGFISITK